MANVTVAIGTKQAVSSGDVLQFGSVDSKIKAIQFWFEDGSGKIAIPGFEFSSSINRFLQLEADPTGTPKLRLFPIVPLFTIIPLEAYDKSLDLKITYDSAVLGNLKIVGIDVLPWPPVLPRDLIPSIIPNPQIL